MGVSENRKGEFRLLRQIHGKGAFGEVHATILATRVHDEPRVIWSVDADDASSAGPDHYPDECAAAVEGAHLALGLLESIGVQVGRQTAHLTFLGINEADTEPSAVRAAATAAVMQAFGLADRCELVYDTEWHYQLKPNAE
jgi:hypothetical protein